MIERIDVITAAIEKTVQEVAKVVPSVTALFPKNGEPLTIAALVKLLRSGLQSGAFNDLITETAGLLADLRSIGKRFEHAVDEIEAKKKPS